MNLSAQSGGDLPPPPCIPPPLLSDSQILSLAHTGSLPLPLSPRLRKLYSELKTAATKFLSLPNGSKADLYGNINSTELGYVSIPGEKEYISFRAQTIHAAESELERIAAPVWQETYTLLYRVLCDLAWAMNINYDVWNEVVDGISPMPKQLEHATPTFLRMFRYESNDGIAESHTDLGLLTLCVGQGQGLQTLSVLSGGRVKAGVHPVVGNKKGRSSTVFALRPSTKHEIDMSAFLGGEQNMVQMGDLWKKMWMGAFNVNAPRDIRVKQKGKQKSVKENTEGIDDEQFYDQTNTLAAITG